ncbi:tRNA pseudouridine(55) synthase TruB [Hespellia stercorisuis]|uniref:tRNA pseudouridine synthase B n=1 Tax=Hespellia stercorisuis DSM 15480 TaxID=1121950 RepID=A0A1M6HPR6_9FIRM|nr:tRNA pseudouridine(55) synthase TruB [Hespellia stercorisuis]SHJ24221.1 tRNA pseudouridine synthase B [Hespellia stercorisuis DSM 15480]
MIHGVINVYKEKGYTSHDVVAKLRGIVGQKKIGHTGTLDPDATGVLPVCFGKATKLCDMLTNKDKVYETVLLLGKTTDTQDISGTILDEKDCAGLTEQAVMDCIQGYIGPYDQLPPMYSALKVNGKKLYELAREGKEVERKTRRIEIYDIQILEMKLPRVRMVVSCSKGTYIRTLLHDIGGSLGVGGCMEELERTKVSCFTLRDSETLAQIEERKQNGTLDEILIPVDAMFDEYEKVFLNERGTFLACNGNLFSQNEIEGAGVYQVGEYVRVYDDKQRFVAVYQYEGGQIFRIVKMFLAE